MSFQRITKCYYQFVFHICYCEVALHETDISDVMVRGGFERFRPDGTVQLKSAPWWEIFYSGSHLFRAYMSLYKLDWMFLTQEQSIVQRIEALEKLKGCMQQFQTLATAKGATLVFLFHPTINDIKAGEMMSTKALLQYANEKGYHTVNALDEFVNAGINENNIGDFFWLQDGHNNSRGYKIIAEGIAKAL